VLTCGSDVHRGSSGRRLPSGLRSSPADKDEEDGEVEARRPEGTGARTAARAARQSARGGAGRRGSEGTASRGHRKPRGALQPRVRSGEGLERSPRRQGPSRPAATPTARPRGARAVRPPGGFVAARGPGCHLVSAGGHSGTQRRAGACSKKMRGVAEPFPPKVTDRASRPMGCARPLTGRPARRLLLQPRCEQRIPA
jgi:hypothetical protein